MATVDDTNINRIFAKLDSLDTKLDKMRDQFARDFVSQQVFTLETKNLKEDIDCIKTDLTTIQERELNKGQRVAILIGGVSGFLSVAITVLQHIKIF